MRTIVFFSVFFTLISSAAFGELTKQDLEEIRAIVKEEVDEVKEEVKKVEENLNTRISDLAVSIRWMIGILALIIVGAFVLPQFLGRSEKTDLKEFQEIVKELRDRMTRLEAKVEGK